MSGTITKKLAPATVTHINGLLRQAQQEALEHGYSDGYEAGRRKGVVLGAVLAVLSGIVLVGTVAVVLS